MIGTCISGLPLLCSVTYFSTADCLPACSIVEVTPSEATSKSSISSYLGVLKTSHRTALLTGTNQGFVCERMFDPCYQEAIALVEEGCSPDRVDKIITDKLGFKRGPFGMLDIRGINTDIDYRKEKVQRQFQEYQQYLLLPEEEKTKKEVKKQPSSLPEVDETAVIVVKAPVVFRNWHSSLLDKMCAENLTGPHTAESERTLKNIENDKIARSKRNKNNQKTKNLQIENMGSGFYVYGRRDKTLNPAAMEIIEQHRAETVRQGRVRIRVKYYSTPLVSSLMPPSSL